MRVSSCALAGVLFCLAVLPAKAAHTRAQLLLKADSARPGDSVLAGVRLQMEPGWHTYWKNPGDAGIATTIEWQLPAGVTAGEIRWPLPQKQPESGLTTYVYTNEVVLLVPLKLAPGISAGGLELKAKVSWLECSVLCVPGSGNVQANLTVGSETKRSEVAALLDKWEQSLPREADGLAPRAWWENDNTNGSRRLLIEWNSTVSADEADFFPETSEQFEVQAGTERMKSESGKIRIRKEVKETAGDWPNEVRGVLAQSSSAGQLAYAVKLRVESHAAAVLTNPALKPGAERGNPVPSLWKMLGYAFLGGLVLNIMPCVLPVIALKILGFVSQAKDNPREVRKLGLVYTSGVLVSFLFLAGIVIGLQAAGRSVGWGFQFSSPYFLASMTVLVTLIALNLFGLFEVTISGRALTAASNLSAQHGTSGAFFNGLLATVLATSCSAPFLAAAIGFAFDRPATIVTLIMLTVGIGLAAPYILLSWHPAWLALLPKPGPWMEKFKVAMGFPMLAAAVWLCSLLTIHYGERAWWMAVFLVFLAVAAWVYGEFVQRGRKRRGLATGLAVIILACGYGYAVETELRWREPIKETAQEELPNEAPRGIAWKPWSPEAVAEARAKHRPVVVDFTAKWCPTCNTIVKPTLETAAVQKKLREIDAVPLLANYTRQPPSITTELRRFSRAGVPLVLVYPRNPDAAPIVFDIITPNTFLAALDQAAR